MSTRTGKCATCGKRCYLTRHAARQARKAKRLHSDRRGLNVYRCEGSGYYHLGHLSDLVRRGRVTRDEMYGEIK